MNLSQFRGVAGCLAALLCLTAVSAGARGQPVVAEPGPAVKGKRVVYFVKHASAADLAAAVRGHYKGEADVQAVEGPGGCVLVRAAPAVCDEVVELLGRLDRHPRQVAIEVLIVESTGKDGGLDAKELTGPADKARERLAALKAKGKVTSFKSVRLLGLENQKAAAVESVNAPSVVGFSGGRGGLGSRSVTYRSLGTSVTVTPRVSAGGAVVLDLQVESSRRSARDGAVLDDSDKNAVVRAPAFVTSTLNAKLEVPAGQAVLARGDESAEGDRASQTLVVVTARVVGAGPRPRK
jgi:type II secretory pathway component GspD/PulD (secretin)